jgi:hypothetical protein
VTTPVPQGYPDYGRLQPISDINLVVDTSHSSSTPITYGPFYVGLFRALYVRFSGSGGRSRIEIDSLNSNNLGDVARAQSVDIGDGQLIPFTLRPFTPWMSFIISQPAATTVQSNLVISAIADTDSAIPEISPVYGITKAGVAIGATSTAVEISASAHIGEVYWNAAVNNGNWVAQLEVVNRDGAVTVVAKTDNLTGRAHERVFIGSGAPQIRIINNVAAAAVYDAFLICNPYTGR